MCELTGKCKEDFDNWIKTEMYYLGSEPLSDLFMNALYMEFFDSVDIKINIEVIYDRASEYIRGFDSDVIFIMHGSLYVNNSDCLKNDIYETRLEAVNLAVIKANEIYNHLQTY